MGGVAAAEAVQEQPFAAVIGRQGLDCLIATLANRGYRILGPVIRDGVIMLGELGSTEELPVGWRDVQVPGSYRLKERDDEALFGWAIGPQSFKSQLFPSEKVLWKARRDPQGNITFESEHEASQPIALIGARPCEVAALSILDRVLAGGECPDPVYVGKREDLFVVAVECGSPSGTCFCSSMGTGPAASSGFDIALTEILEGEHRFVMRAGSVRGGEVLSELPHTTAGSTDLIARARVIEQAQADMGRRLETEGLPGLLASNIEHPRWEDVANRCLSCGNCTMVCPTCFCSTVADTSALDDSIQRVRTWASCFDLQHSYLHGGPVRVSTKSRYRQWMTHKLSTWQDQFGTSGCVGCGRCITWCPAGIDITEEAAHIRAADLSRQEEGAR